MDSPLLPIITDLIMQDFEEIAFNRLSFKIPIYYRYVDDILIAAPEDNIKYILEVFNSLHNRLSFTAEIRTVVSIF